MVILLASLTAACDESTASVATRHLGPGAACAAPNGYSDSPQISCVHEGKAYLCVIANKTVTCAPYGSTNPAERQ